MINKTMENIHEKYLNTANVKNKKCYSHLAIHTLISK